MTCFRAFFVVFIIILGCVGQASAGGVTPSLELEKKIAYQQGQFGALYARCGSGDEKTVIGGSLATWRTETFQGYKGSPNERRTVEKAFDSATTDIALDTTSCHDWIKQASATWQSITVLASNGLPVTSGR